LRSRARRIGVAARRRLRELPQDDGLVPVLMFDIVGGMKRHFWARVPPEVMHDACAATMAKHDARSDDLRWGCNQWGEDWAMWPERRNELLCRMPLLKTDLTLRQWRQELRAMRG